jgi:hypothetical protein
LRLPRVDLVALGLFGRREVKYGELSTGIAALNSAVHLWRSTGALDFAASLGIEVGFTWGRADPRSSANGESRRRMGPFISGFAQLSFGGAISNQAYAHAGLAAGYGIGVHGREKDERAGTQGASAGTMGAFVSLEAGFGWSL